MRYLAPEPVSPLGLAALLFGFAAFLVALLLARSRGIRAPESPDSGRRNASIVWIVVQGVGIGIAGFGPVAIRLGPASPIAIGRAVIVLALMLAAAWLFHASSRAMGRNWALVARTRQDGNLVQSGPFALVRNPIYVALFGILLAIAIGFGHLANLIVAVPLFAHGTWMRVRHEEAVLRASFGAAYDAYAARVKRFVPGLM